MTGGEVSGKPLTSSGSTGPVGMTTLFQQWVQVARVPMSSGAARRTCPHSCGQGKRIMGVS